jgi:hypothetical protein
VNGLLDNSLVGLALLISAGYALSSLGPRTLRRRVLAAAARLLERSGLRRLSTRLDAASKGKAQSACGGCDGCESEPAGTPRPPGAEVGVPVDKISRRMPSA